MDVNLIGSFTLCMSCHEISFDNSQQKYNNIFITGWGTHKHSRCSEQSEQLKED